MRELGENERECGRLRFGRSEQVGARERERERVWRERQCVERERRIIVEERE